MSVIGVSLPALSPCPSASGKLNSHLDATALRHEGSSTGVCPAYDPAPDAAESALRKILAGELVAPPPSAREAYAYPALAERYEQTLERAISRREGRDGNDAAQRSVGGRTRSADNAPAASR